jgi:hypothetical protein
MGPRGAQVNTTSRTFVALRLELYKRNSKFTTDYDETNTFYVQSVELEDLKEVREGRGQARKTRHLFSRLEGTLCESRGLQEELRKKWRM